MVLTPEQKVVETSFQLLQLVLLGPEFSEAGSTLRPSVLELRAFKDMSPMAPPWLRPLPAIAETLTWYRLKALPQVSMQKYPCLVDRTFCSKVIKPGDITDWPKGSFHPLS